MRQLKRLRLKGKAVLVVTALVLSGALGGAIYVSFHRADSYVAFRQHCLSHAGNSVVTLSSAKSSSYMGGTSTKYTMGCQAADGTISSHATTTRP